MSGLFIVPVLVLVGANVVASMRAMRSSLDAVPSAAAAVSRQAVYATLLGAARYAVALSESERSGASKVDALKRALKQNPGFVAIRIRSGDDVAVAVRPQDEARGPQIVAALDVLPSTQPDVKRPAFPGDLWLRPLRLGSEPGFGLRAALAGGGDVEVLMDGEYLSAIVDAIDSRADARVALVDDGLHPLNDIDDGGWLPAPGFALDGESGVVARSVDGLSRRYGVAAIAGPHAYVLAAIDSAASGAWRARYPLLLLLPALALALVSYVFLRTLKTGVVDWVVGLDSVARRSRADPSVRAEIFPTMPSEIETVSRSLNEVLDARDARESELFEALTHNRALTRELHHRVKNSLQLVQSYLALAAREAREPARAPLLAAQCRAYILSAAYRRALAEGEMRAIELDAFLGDVAAYAANLLRGSGQTVVRGFETEAFAGIDEAIPLGMIVVELVDSGLRELGADAMHVLVRPMGSGAGMIVAGSNSARPFPAPGRLLVGLMRQVGAVAAEPPPGSQFCVRFEMPRPPEHFRLADTTHAGGAPDLPQEMPACGVCAPSSGNQSPAPTL